MHKASYYLVLNKNKVKCLLCPHECTIADGHHGICKTRKNIDGSLFLMVYGKPIALHPDPVEKKPLYHFYPGRSILSLGTVGCNMECFFCQNCTISQATPSENHTPDYNAEDIINYGAGIVNNIGIAFTYNEPVVFFEYMLDIAKLAVNKGFKNVMISNGYINREPLKELTKYIDAFNIDLKSFSDSFYKRHTKSTLSPVLETIKTIHQSGRHLELTYLVIPELNDNPDNFANMIDWIKSETGGNTVLHLSKYFPHYMSHIPPTPDKALNDMYNIAIEQLSFVYLGNSHSQTGRDTYCPGCKKSVISRMGYKTTITGLDSKGFCIECGNTVVQYI